MEAQRLINPWKLHLQKLSLELKCPSCLQLLDRPVLLPCNHIFCNSCQIGSECAVCKHSFIDRDVKPATFMENILTIFKNLEATISANSIHPVSSSDTGKVSTQCPASSNKDVHDTLRKDNVDTSKNENSSNSNAVMLQVSVPNLSTDENLVDRSFEKCVTPESVEKQEFNANGGDKHKGKGVEGVGFMCMEQLTPPRTSESKDVDGSSDPNDNHKNASKHSLKRPANSDACGTLKKNRSNSSGVNCDAQTNNLASENVAIINCNSETDSVRPGLDGPSDQLDLKSRPCAFCKTSDVTDGSGVMVAYANGKQVKENLNSFSKVSYVHEKCAMWAPRVCFDEKTGSIINLESEIARANKLKCTSCGKKGAALGCKVDRCEKTYHVPCAFYIFDCQWDTENYYLWCPTHASDESPKKKKSNASRKSLKKNKSNLGKLLTNKRISSNLSKCTTLVDDEKKLVLCGSALSVEQKFILADFAQNNGAFVSKYWKDNVTHVVAATDSTGACTRTLKVLMAILNGKWILTMEWIKACEEAGHVVDEEPYEVQVDTHGCSGGPKAGRLRALTNGPKLFNNMHFYFVGDYVEAFKADLLNLVKTAGGIIIENKDKLLSTNYAGVKLDKATLVVYNADHSICAENEDEDEVKLQRLAVAEDLAEGCGFYVVGHTWILESIAGCVLLPFR